ncbi:alpha/beta hydrolase [Bacillus sp. JJ1562]|uniref:alpha/beta hydrolase n=1 Tax=Bacillus sp. JJ1562 TaxID=3122960 RepID=UPI003002133A
MMKLVKPKPFFLKGGDKAVLLLHSFTSNTRDVKELGKFLHMNGFSCYAPVYEGHGLSPEQLVSTNPKEWWRSVEEGYHFLIKEGYAQIAVIGISLGGIFALNIGQTFKVNGIVTMSVPYKREISSLKGRLLKYARAFKQFEGKDEKEISIELDQLEKSPCLINFKNHIDTTMEGIERINQPIRIMYGELDESLYKESAIYIHDRVSTNDKSIHSYPNSTHLMTLGSDQKFINKDILSFLMQLHW